VGGVVGANLRLSGKTFVGVWRIFPSVRFVSSILELGCFAKRSDLRRKRMSERPASPE
jgi:hypothetical protein